MPRAFHLADDRDPWKQQPGESDAMYQRFCVYLNDKRIPRKLSDVAVELAKGRKTGPRKITVPSLMTYANRYKWIDRARAFDEKRQAKVETNLLDVAKAVAAEHLAFAAKIRERVAEELEAIPVGKASHGDLARWMTYATDIERRTLGLDAPRRVEVSGPGGGALNMTVGGEPTQPIGVVLDQLRDRAQAFERAQLDDSD